MTAVMLQIRTRVLDDEWLTADSTNAVEIASPLRQRPVPKTTVYGMVSTLYSSRGWRRHRYRSRGSPRPLVLLFTVYLP
jgi:hypothetical protein